jgi:hypothetical protein
MQVYNLDYYLNDNNMISFGFVNNQEKNSLDYTAYDLVMIHYDNQNKDKFMLHLERMYPENEKIDFANNITLDFQKKLGKDLTMDLSVGKVYNNTLGEEETFASLKFTQAFGITSGTSFTQQYEDEDYSSRVTGQVYLDENNNKLLDEGEEKLSNIKMVMNSLTDTTDEDGNFKFKVIRPGIYKLNFKLDSLSADYTPIDKEKIVKVRKNENLKVDFGLTMNGSIAGKVFRDKNSNGKLDQNEEAVNRVGLVLNQQEKTTYTDTCEFSN